MQLINKICIALFVTCASTMASSYCYAQVGKNIYLGIAPGVNFVKYNTSSFSIPNADAAILQNGSGIAPLLGISCNITINCSYEREDYVVLEAYYDSKSATFSNRANEGNTITASIPYLLLNAGYKYNFIPAPTRIGPALQLSTYMGYKLPSSFHSDANNFTASIDGAKTLRFGLRGQLMYDVPLTYDPGWLGISPFIGYDYPFTKVDNTDRSWRASSIYAGIVFRFLIYDYDLMPM